MSILSQLAALVDESLETQPVDMRETSKGGGGFERKVLEAGTYYLRFIEYVELGKRIPMQDGKPTGKPSQLNVRLGFVIYAAGEQIMLNPYPMNISNNEKAKFKILFDRMNAKGDIKHMAQCLGNAYSIELKKAQTKAGKDYNQLQFGTLAALPKFDPETGEAVKLPDFDESMLKLFLWNKPTKETWDALEIKGTNDKGVSKNFIQEDILKAVDYDGSPLQELLEGKLPEAPKVAAVPQAPTAPAEDTPPFKDTPPNNETGAASVAPAAPTAPAAPVAPQAPVAPTA